MPHPEVASRVERARIGFIPLPDLPKFQHNIPTKLFEFMSLGMPTVLSDLPPSRPFVGDGQCALMVPADDPVAYADAVESLYGRIRIESNEGAGTSITLVVPTVRDLQRVLIVDSGGTRWGIPEAVIDAMVPIESANIISSGGREAFVVDGVEMPLAPIAGVVGATDGRPPVQVVALSHRAGNAAVTVNEVLGIREVAAKELGFDPGEDEGDIVRALLPLWLRRPDRVDARLLNRFEPEPADAPQLVALAEAIEEAAEGGDGWGSRPSNRS